MELELNWKNGIDPNPDQWEFLCFRSQHKVPRSPMCGHSGRLLIHYRYVRLEIQYIDIKKIQIDYRSKFSYQFILSISIIYGNTNLWYWRSQFISWRSWRCHQWVINGKTAGIITEICAEPLLERWAPHLTKIAQQGAKQGIWGQCLGAVTHEDVGWPAPAWVPGLTQQESFLILQKTIPLQELLTLERDCLVSQWITFGCLHLGQWPMTYLMTLSDWTMSCQPWPPRARYGQWARYK